MGSADIIPGVSGGTMAFILGIYARLIRAIRSFDMIFLRALARGDVRQAASHVDSGFLILLLTGIIAALLVFTRVIPVPYLLKAYPEPVYSLFFGLILASVVYLLVRVERWRVRDSVFLIAGTIIGWLVFTLIPVETPDAPWFLFLAGAVSICAMILPGISGSFVLLILNKYSTVFNAIGYFQLAVLIPFILGAVTGLLLFSRLLSLLLNRCYRATMQFITGLLVASLWVIWPFQDRTYEMVGGSSKIIASTPALPYEIDGMFLLSVLLFAAGCAVVFVMHAMVKDKTTGEE
ncbi:MAG: DUF368 domain-containing protein [Gammaproteobacteria bacterium]